MDKKYELTTDTIIHFGKKLFRIKALISFGNVEVGELGGYVESEKNLSQDGDAWVYGNARVCGDARVYGNAWVCGNAEVCDDARVCGDAWVCGDARVYGNAWVCGNAEVCDDARVYGNADYVCTKGLGPCWRNTTFFKCKNGGIGVVCGCFKGNLDEFTEKVKSTHGDSKYAKEYLAMVDVIKIHFEKEDKDDTDDDKRGV